MYAAVDGNIDIVLALIKANANVNDKNKVNILLSDLM
jgi:ankyrin repeat protein